MSFLRRHHKKKDDKQEQDVAPPLPQETNSSSTVEGEIDSTADDRRKLWTKISGLVGKDIVSMMSLPVSLFEPVSVLQSMCEPLRNAPLLDRAAGGRDPVENIAYLAGFITSLYAYYVRTKKPFNPLLGETYEYERKNGDYKIIAEQVSHHPPIGVAYTTGQNWTLCQESKIETKFWGATVDVASVGSNSFETSSGDSYSWKSPSACLHNIILGKIYIEYFGTVPIRNMRTGHTATINFKKAGWFGGVNHEINGEIRDKDNVLRAVLKGKWNDHVTMTRIDDRGAKGATTTIWQRPDSSLEFDKTNKWKWDRYLEELTEMDDELEAILPTTDARLREDLRALAVNNIKLAGKEKTRIEEKERQKRRDRDAQGKKFTPQLFKKVQDEQQEYKWVYAGNYWEEKEQRKQQAKDKTLPRPLKKSYTLGDSLGSSIGTPELDSPKFHSPALGLGGGLNNSQTLRNAPRPVQETEHVQLDRSGNSIRHSDVVVVQ
eukprot:TRINITY_DN140_c0_g1_i1.p1 TRINITY_DN140_c0_g1~~TRINITY_DN140_c0_g1_i1.p1  ORF type:complete len:490 (+),score=140.93 TRINITY_DN140_c0_g1_i1:72-1541(+)